MNNNKRLMRKNPVISSTPGPDQSGWIQAAGWWNRWGPIRPLNANCIVENNQIRWCRVALLHCVDLRRVSRARASPGSQLFLSTSNLSVSLEPSGTNETHNHWCLQTGVAVAARESVSQAATPAIRAICAALSAQMFPLAPLKVADITGGLDDLSGGFIM